ncbi:MAG: hypothetical protein CMJ18_04095 [Phycisphaeraceae bacterium]|nr:hypothetical protein [Phycisphaeraceae bacterium]
MTHFRVSNITGGSLFQNDGTTPINDGDYITFAEGQDGVKFVSSANSNAAGSFDVEASEDGSAVAAQSGTATSTITVTPVGDTPTAASITTVEDAQSGAIALDRHASDGAEVTHFRISNITNGSLFQNDGTTPISDGVYITVAEGQAGLRFTPDANENAPGSFVVDASEDGTTVAAQSTGAISTITITPVGDTPVPSNATTAEDTQSDPIVITRHASDGAEVTHFRISNITNGSLFQNDGATPVSNGDYITFAQGQTGLRFTPSAETNLAGTFDVESSEDGSTVAAQSGAATATINVTAVNDAPTATNLAQTKAFTEGDATVAIDNIVITDTDIAEVVTAELTLADPAAGVLTISGAATYNAVSGVWSIIGTVTAVNLALADVAFEPAVEQDVDTTIAVRITDGGEDGAGAAEGVITLDVTAINDPPTVATPIPDRNAPADQPFVFQVAAGTFADADTGTVLTYTATLDNNDPLPGWLAFNSTDRVFSGTPTNANLGTIDVKVTVDDGAGGSVSDTFSVTTADITPPAAPSAPDLTDASDSGGSNSDDLTSDATATFTGTAEAGVTVDILADGVLVGTGTADGGGAYSITVSALGDGVHAMTARATDASSNASPVSDVLTLTVDTTAPATPGAPDLTEATDTGASSTDDVTMALILGLEGIAEAGSSLAFFADGTDIGTGSADGTGAYSILSDVLADATHSITVQATDAAGNQSAASAALVVVVDQTAPAAPSNPDLDAGSDTGDSDSDDVTASSTPAFAGTADAGTTVRLFAGGSEIGSDNANGSYTVTSSALADGVYSVNAISTDVAGNISFSGGTVVTVDTTAPSSVGGFALAASSDTGASDGDRVTSESTPTFVGTAESGSTVRVFADGTEVASIVVDGSGQFSVATSTLADGAHLMTTTVTDPAGNVSTATPGLTVTVDTGIPAAPTAPALHPDSDSGDADNVTHDNTPTFTGTADPGGTVDLYSEVGANPPQGVQVFVASGGDPVGVKIGSGIVDESGSFSITSMPLPEGVQSVTATVTDVAGNVSGASDALAVTIDTTSPFVDLVGSFAEIDLSSAILADGGSTGDVSVTVTNQGNASVASGQRIDVTILLRPAEATDDSADVAVHTMSDVSVSGLKAEGSKTFVDEVTLPALEQGDYRFVARIDAADDADESDESNNTVVGDDVFTAAEAMLDLSATIVVADMPDDVVAGDGTKIKAQVTVSNVGNTSTAADELVDVHLLARPADAVDDSQDVLVTTLENQAVRNLAPGASRTFNATAQLPEGLLADDYRLVALVEIDDDGGPGGSPDASAGNNADATDDTVSVAAPVVDLVGGFGDITLHSAVLAGEPAKGRVPVVITNAGTTAVASGAKVDVRLVARPTSAVDDTQDVALSTLENRSVSGLKAGASRKFTTTVTLPDTLDADDYAIVAFVDDGDAVAESDETNNTAISEHVTTVAGAFVDLEAEFTVDAPSAVVLGQGGTGRATVVVTNRGNQSIVGGQRVDVRIAARPVDAVDDSQDVDLVVIDDASVSGLRPDRSKTLRTAVTLPAGLAADDYRFVAFVDDGLAVAESDEANNVAIGEHVTTVAGQFVDLVATVDGSRLPDDLTSGDGTRIRLPLTIENLGNVAVAKGQLVDVDVFVRPAGAVDDSQDVLITTVEGRSVSNLAPDKIRKHTLNVQVPAGVATGDYVIVAHVDPAGAVADSDPDNNVAVTPADSAIDVELGEIDLVAALGAVTLSSAIDAAEGDSGKVTIDITNDGTVSVARGQDVDVRIALRPFGAQDDSGDVLLLNRSQSLSGLKPGKTKRVTSNVDVPAGLQPGAYQVVVTVDAGDAVAESDEANTVLGNSVLTIA